MHSTYRCTIACPGAWSDVQAWRALARDEPDLGAQRASRRGPVDAYTREAFGQLGKGNGPMPNRLWPYATEAGTAGRDAHAREASPEDF